MSEALSFPGAVGITHLKVYDDTAIDGLVGGSPHFHLVSAEAYIPTRGSGTVQTWSREGSRDYELSVGRIVWFEPGVIHRLVNTSGDLEILVVMQNAGLPEAGDAVFTFPAAVMADDGAYAASATLPEGPVAVRRAAASRRRDLAVQGFEDLIAAGDAGLDELYAAAIRLRRGQFARWSALLESGAEQEARLARARLESLVGEDVSLLGAGRRATVGEGDDHPGVGMCGMLRQYDLIAR